LNLFIVGESSCGMILVMARTNSEGSLLETFLVHWWGLN
jgi:hypothetical protein